MSIINKKSEQFLTNYLNNFSPTGYEAEGQKLWLNYISPFVDEKGLDNYGSAYGVINPGQAFRVVVEAHSDEISWYVSYITSDGFINVIRNGGSDHVIAPSMRVYIHKRKGGTIDGVFGWPAIHTRHNGDSPNPTVDNIFIDVGAESKQEVEEMGIHVGCVVTFKDEMGILNGKYYYGRALDNRLGGFCIAEVARILKEKKIKLPFSLYFVNAVQEEVGLRGAQMITETIKPHVALVVDVTHDSKTPLMNSSKLGEIKTGKGPSLTYAPAVHNKLLDLIIDAAEDEKIPFQREASSRVTGTDTDAFAYSNGGVPSALISIPLKYMHTTVEMAHKQDVEDVIKLLVASVKRIQNNHDFKYFKV